MPHSMHPSPVPDPLPYWNVNIPPEKQTAKCPDFLLNLSEKDIGILSTTDEDYHRQSWPEVQELVKTNRIELFQRVPTDLRRYRKYTSELKQRFGSVLAFVQHERVNWPGTTLSGAAPFTNPADYKILFNDWPYGIDEDITHLVVWTKLILDADPVTGELTAEARAVVERFVQRTFVEGEGRVGKARCVWFKNWTSLRSVHALEHFHVMLYRADKGFLEQVTDGDVSMQEKVKRDE